jgi:hypothetical protein
MLHSNPVPGLIKAWQSNRQSTMIDSRESVWPWQCDKYNYPPHLPCGENMWNSVNNEVSVAVSITLCWPSRVRCLVCNKHEVKYVHKSNADKTQEKTRVTRKHKAQPNISPVYFLLQYGSYWSQTTDGKTSSCEATTRVNVVILSCPQSLLRKRPSPATRSCGAEILAKPCWKHFSQVSVLFYVSRGRNTNLS